MTRRYLMRWPITDVMTPLAVLTNQAEADLRAALASEQLRPAGRVTWSFQYSRRSTLAAELDVEPLAATA